jgi:NADH:ubiquinone reductase (H+-translocating)
MRTRWRIVILGHSASALRSAISLDRAIFSRDDVQVTLVSARESHDIDPMLPEVLLGDRSAVGATVQIERLLAARQVTLALGDEPRVDIDSSVVTAGPTEYHYDALIVCPTPSQPGPEWAGAVALPSASDVSYLRVALTERVRRAAWSLEPAERRQALTAVVIGAGYDGVVWAGALAVALRRLAVSMRLPQELATVHLVEGDHRVLPNYSRAISANAGELLGRAGVTSRLRARAIGAAGGRVTLSDGEVILADTVVLCAGWNGSPIATLPSTAGGSGGRLMVNRRLRMQLPGFVYAAGAGVALAEHDLNSPPAPWEHATRQADVAAHNALAAMMGEGELSQPDVPADLVMRIGEWALATFGPIVLAGPLAIARQRLECARYLEAVGGAAAVLSSACAHK